MHWQQYYTLLFAVLGGSMFLVSSLFGRQELRPTATIQLALVVFSQWVLYSGGWYN